MIVKDFLKYVRNKQIIKITCKNKQLFCNIKSILKSDYLLNKKIDKVVSIYCNELIIIVEDEIDDK